MMTSERKVMSSKQDVVVGREIKKKYIYRDAGQG